MRLSESAGAGACCPLSSDSEKPGLSESEPGHSESEDAVSARRRRAAVRFDRGGARGGCMRQREGFGVSSSWLVD